MTEKELRAAREDAEPANRAKHLSPVNLRHELRTPLNAIIGYAELLRDELRDEGLAGHAEDAERIRDAGQKLLAMITDILDLANADTGTVQTTVEVND